MEHEFSVGHRFWMAAARGFSHADTDLMAVDALFAPGDVDFLVADAELASIDMLWRLIVELSKCDLGLSK